MLKTFKQGGVHPPEYKFTQDRPIETASLPKMVTLPLTQHIGAPAKPVVKKNDTVKVGDLIAEGEGFVSAKVHASVSGTVKKVDKISDYNGYKVPAIVIETDGDEWNEDIDKNNNLRDQIDIPADEIRTKIRDAGIVGLGGAAFPTHVKITVPQGKTAEYLIINGAECEPFLTADHRLMLEHTKEILIGAQLVKRALGARQVYIGIEHNKPDAISAFKKMLKGLADVRIIPVRTKYPQGAEKQLIKAITGREVPSGGLPIDAGVVVLNVGSTYASYEAVQKNKPLIERFVTVSGKHVSNSSNFRVRIGTPVSHLIDTAGGIPENTGKILLGGPMMGKAMINLDAPVVKGSSGIVILPDELTRRRPVRNCIRCARCVSKCPMGLEPYLLMNMVETEQFEQFEKRAAMDCIECGSCNFICPASRPLLDYIKLGKTEVRNRKKK